MSDLSALARALPPEVRRLVSRYALLQRIRSQGVSRPDVTSELASLESRLMRLLHDAESSKQAKRFGGTDEPLRMGQLSAENSLGPPGEEIDVLRRETTMDETARSTEPPQSIIPSIASTGHEIITSAVSEPRSAIGVESGVSAELVSAGSETPPLRDLRAAVVSLYDGCAELLEEYLWLSTLGERPRRVGIDFFVRVVASIAGSEVEGKEVTVAVAIGPSISGVLSAGPDLEISLPRRFDSPGEAIRFLREIVGSEAVGPPGGSVALFSPGRGDFLGLVQIALSGSEVATADDAMHALSTDGRYQGILVHPASSVRLFSGGEFVAQIIRLRDGLGWSIRRVELLVTTFQALAPFNVDARVAREVVESLACLSERRSGAAIYVFPRDTDLMSQGTCREHGIVRRLIHTEGVPIVLQRELLLSRLSQDGAVAISADGQLLASRVYFHGPGGRRRTAEYICRKGAVVAAVVSQDGPMFFASREFVEIDADRFS